MPVKNRFPVLPYMDPDFDKNHPLNHLPPIPEDPLFPMTPREKERLEREQAERAMLDYKPSHVLRSYESDDEVEAQRTRILGFVLHPKAVVDLDDLRFRSPNDSSLSKAISKQLYDPSRDVEHTDFRQFLVKSYHLGYNRFHATHGESNFPSEEDDPDIDPEHICWIMEYTEGECNIVRRKLAKLMGEFPASVDLKNSLYDEEVAWRYERRLYVRCRRRNKRCIRPSHIEVFTSAFRTLP